MEFDEIIVKESPGLCRCCLSEGCYKDLGVEYVWMDETEVYADMLLECFDISISQHIEGPNGPSRLICEVCITRLRDACNFKKQVVESEKKFIDMLGRGEFKSKVIVYEEQMKSEVNVDSHPPGEAEVEFLDEDIDYDDCTNNDDLEPTVSEDITVATLPIKGKRGRPRKNAVKPEKKKSKIEDKPKTKVVRDEVPYGLCTSERRRKNLQILFNNTSIIPFKWRGRYICFYCGQNYTEYKSFRKHTKSHGLCSTADHALKLIKGNHIEIKIDVSEIACEICCETLTSFTEIVDHLVNKHDLKYDKSIDIPFQEYQLSDCRCRICGEVFTYFGFLITHTNVAHPQNTFICDICGEKFNKKRDLAIHIKRFHQDGGYPCDECSEVFISQGLLSKHKNNFHFRRCKICDSRFPSYTLLKKHVQCDHADDKCPYCSKKCQTSQGLRQHVSKCNKKTIIDTKLPFPEETMQPIKKKDVNQIRKNILCVLNMSTAVPFKFFTKYSCFYCSKSYVEFEELKEHVVVAHPFCDIEEKCIKNCKGERISVKLDISSLACRVCYESSESIDGLVDHLILKHKAEYDKSAIDCFESFKIVKDNIPCPICSTVFRYFGSLLRHINSEHSDNNKICDFCGRSFKKVANLRVHITYAHLGPFECDICKAKFKNQWCLGRHKAKYHNAKEFQCKKCPELFQSQYHKQKHMIKVHNIGHKCSHCGKMFTRNSFMKDHVRRTHLKEKNVLCTVCNEKFFDNYLLKLHMVKHKGERKFSCEFCGKTFLRRSNLSAHTDMHKKYGHV